MGSRGPYCRQGKPLSQAQQSPELTMPLSQVRVKGCTVGASCIPKGPDLAPQKPSVWGGAANRGFLPFHPYARLYSFTQAGQARFCLSGGDITGYACMRGCNGLHRLLHLSLPTSLCWMFCVSVMNGVTLHLELPEDLGRTGRCCLKMVGRDSRIESVSSRHPSAEPGHLLTWCSPVYLGDMQECALGRDFLLCGYGDSVKACWYLPYRPHPCFCRHRQDMSFLGSSISSKSKAP